MSPPRCPPVQPPPVRLPQQPSRLERLAYELDAEPWELRLWLYEEISRRADAREQARNLASP